jgi:enoyl-CoA hydratase/carnithine racemase
MRDCATLCSEEHCMAYEHLLVDHDGPLTRITMNRPERRNALSMAHMGELIAAVRAVGEREATRAVVLAGNGPAFCAGHDLRELLGRDLGAYRAVFERCAELMTSIQRIPQPVIAQVHGIATAAGCQLAASCDLVVASEEARFATPGVSIGLFCTTPMVALTRAIGRKRAMEMLLTGDPIDAQTAEAWGLVNHVVPAAQLATAVAALAERIIAASPLTLAIGKQAFYAQIDLDQPKAYDYASEVMASASQHPDAQEGMRAFLEKRRPVFEE